MTPRLTSIIITTHTQQWYINKKWQVRRRQWRRRRRKDADRWLLAIKRWLHGSLIYTPFFSALLLLLLRSVGDNNKRFLSRDGRFYYIHHSGDPLFYFIFFFFGVGHFSSPRSAALDVDASLRTTPFLFFPLLCRYVSIKGRLIASSQHTHTQEEEED